MMIESYDAYPDPLRFNLEYGSESLLSFAFVKTDSVTQPLASGVLGS